MADDDDTNDEAKDSGSTDEAEDSGSTDEAKDSGSKDSGSEDSGGDDAGGATAEEAAADDDPEFGVKDDEPANDVQMKYLQPLAEEQGEEVPDDMSEADAAEKINEMQENASG